MSSLKVVVFVLASNLLNLYRTLSNTGMGKVTLTYDLVEVVVIDVALVGLHPFHERPQGRTDMPTSPRQHTLQKRCATATYV